MSLEDLIMAEIEQLIEIVRMHNGAHACASGTCCMSCFRRKRRR